MWRHGHSRKWESEINLCIFAKYLVLCRTVALFMGAYLLIRGFAGSGKSGLLDSAWQLQQQVNRTHKLLKTVLTGLNHSGFFLSWLDNKSSTKPASVYHMFTGDQCSFFVPNTLLIKLFTYSRSNQIAVTIQCPVINWSVDWRQIRDVFNHLSAPQTMLAISLFVANIV